MSAAPLDFTAFIVSPTGCISLPETISPIFLAIRHPELDTSTREPDGNFANLGDSMLRKSERGVGAGDKTKWNCDEDDLGSRDVADIME